MRSFLFKIVSYSLLQLEGHKSCWMTYTCCFYSHKHAPIMTYTNTRFCAKPRWMHSNCLLKNRTVVKSWIEVTNTSAAKQSHLDSRILLVMIYKLAIINTSTTRQCRRSVWSNWAVVWSWFMHHYQLLMGLWMCILAVQPPCQLALTGRPATAESNCALMKTMCPDLVKLIPRVF